MVLSSREQPKGQTMGFWGAENDLCHDWNTRCGGREEGGRKATVNSVAGN
jgi:hypothetical protein